MGKTKFSKLLAVLLVLLLLLGQSHNFMALAEDTGSDEQVLFQDDFEYGASNWTVTSGGWSIVDADGSNQYEKDNDYSSSTVGFAVLDDYESPSGLSSRDWTDYSVEADITILHTQGTGPRIEISARFSANNIRYSFAITGSALQIRKRNTGERPLVQKPFTPELGKPYHVKGVLIGNKLEMWVDGVKELEVVDEDLFDEPAIESGTIALNTYLASARYDNVKVLALEESPEEPEPSMTDIELESLVIAEDEELENLINLTFKENMYSANIPFDIT